jgi:hypothetical protein
MPETNPAAKKLGQKGQSRWAVRIAEVYPPMAMKAD